MNPLYRFNRAQILGFLFVLTAWLVQSEACAQTIVGDGTVCAGATSFYSFQGNASACNDGSTAAAVSYQWIAQGGTIQDPSQATCTVVWGSQPSSLELIISGSDQPTTQGNIPLTYVCQDLFTSISLVATQWGAVTQPAFPVCPSSTFTLSCPGTVGVSEVDWYKQDNTGNWVLLGISQDVTANFIYQCTPIAANTVFRADIMSQCNGTQSQNFTVAVANAADAAGQAIGERDVSVGNQGVVTLANYMGDILNWQSSIDGGVSWQDLAGAAEDFAYQDVARTTQYRAKVRACNSGSIIYSTSCTIRVDNSLNWTETKSFSEDGATLLANSRTYFSAAGKEMQSQSKALTANKVLATQPLYGRFDQVVGSTLAAPLPTTDFQYDPAFVTLAGTTSGAYDYHNFDTGTTRNTPDAVGTTRPGSLGWYYSTSNTLEPYTPITAYPYSRSDAMPDGSTGVSRSAGPAPSLQLGSGHEVVQGSFPVRTELDEYAAIRAKLLTTAAVGSLPTTMQQAAVQSLSTDADGTTTLLFADKEGHAVMSARAATSADAWTSTSNTVEIGWPHSIKILYSSTGILQVQGTANVMVYDNQGNWKMTDTPAVVNQYLATGLTGVNVQNYTFYSPEPFTITDAYYGGYQYNSQQREAYSYFNFYIVGDGTASLNSLPNTTASVCHLFNTVTGLEIALPTQANSQIALTPGCYQLRLEKGAVRLTYSNSYKDLSYSFYNQKGQLVETVSPNGVNQLLQAWHRNAPANFPYSAVTAHPFSSTFEYDTQGRNTATNEPDAGRTQYIYRTDGKLRFSQNAKQAALGTFSYVGYDKIGRVVEVGECVINNNSPWSIATIPTSNPDWIEAIYYGGSGLPGYYLRRNVVRTTYDVTNPARDTEAPNVDHNLPGYTATFIAGRVATVSKYSQGQPYGGYTLASQTWFSYDEQGRVIWQIQQTAGQPARTVDYIYNNSGDVQSVCYQKNTALERLTHYYYYDADNRLAYVQTDNNDPANSSVWIQTSQASYTYYLHGPLKRVSYAGGLQGVDYTYTATGQLKSINDGDLKYDPGKDGMGGFSGQNPDLFGTTLNYYQHDYNSAAAPTMTTFMPFGSYQEHYNGLINSTSWQTTNGPMQGNGYYYDYKGQIQGADYGNLYYYSGTRQYGFYKINGNSEGNLDYDSNGNIGHLQRLNGAGVSTMNMGYTYQPGNNRLKSVWDAASPAGSAPLINYTYDPLGQVTEQEETADPTKSKHLDYDASGKVTAIYAIGGNFNDRSRLVARYTYDEFGKRLTQQVYPNPADQTTYTTTTFVRDVAGHELASYVADTKAGATNPLFLYEQPIYGATRLGIFRQARPGDTAPAEQLYELNDQLGNTRVVFRKPTTTTYVLSMETGNVAQERKDFPGPTAPDGSTYDAVRSGDYFYRYSSYGSSYSAKLVGQQGPTKVIAAQRGDQFNISAYALYANSSTSVPQRPAISTATNTLLPALNMLSIQPGLRTGLETNRAPSPSTGWQHTLGQVSIGVSIPLFARKAVSPRNTAYIFNGPPPNSGIQYVVKRASDGATLRSGKTPLQSNSSIDWQSLSLQLTITETVPVLVEISAWNSAYSVPVYFDDLTVRYTTGPVVEENNFYAYGQRNEDLSWHRSDERNYGRGYQGQNTTQDAESGYTAFELRDYDARVGRWLSADPKRQHFSRYLGMGNNPVSRTDANGGEDYNEIGVDIATGKRYTLSNLGGDDYDIIHYGHFNKNFTDLTQEGPDQIVERTHGFDETLNTIDLTATVASVPFGVNDAITKRFLEGTSEYKSLIETESAGLAEASLTGAGKMLKAGSLVGLALGTVGTIHSVQQAWEHRNGPNFGRYVVKATLNAAILGASILQPEIGIADAILDSSTGYKDKLLEKLCGPEIRETIIPVYMP